MEYEIPSISEDVVAGLPVISQDVLASLAPSPTNMDTGIDMVKELENDPTSDDEGVQIQMIQNDLRGVNSNGDEELSDSDDEETCGECDGKIDEDGEGSDDEDLQIQKAQGNLQAANSGGEAEPVMNVHYDKDSQFYVQAISVTGSSFFLKHTGQRVERDRDGNLESLPADEVQKLKEAGTLLTVNPASNGTKFICADGLGTVTSFWDQGSQCGEGATIVGDVNGQVFEGKLVTPQAFMEIDMDDIRDEGLACLLICREGLVHELISRTLGDDGAKGLFFHNFGKSEVGFVTWEANPYFAQPAWKALVSRGQHRGYLDICPGDEGDGHNFQARYWENIGDVEVTNDIANIYEF